MGRKPTLDVIIEHAVLIAVFVEQAEGVGIGKVFKLDEAIYSKPVERQREGLVIPPIPSRSRPALGVGELQPAGRGLWHGSFPGVLPPGWLLALWLSLPRYG